MRKGVGPRGLGSTPCKQTKEQAKEVKVKDVPGIVVDTAANLVNKFTNLTLSTPEGQRRRAKNKADRLDRKLHKTARKWHKAEAKAK